ncbi:MAG: Type 1 glutamine amidotransferase-like domain-containing protein [Candidatus Saccharibacteria bacterium]|nr:Type 1 glutamine amidotransferase-like domain-containing protein [Candidatus Saccharibacteria bacterium]
MRLFLTSHDFGDYQNELLSLMGSGRKALIITNARDYYPDEKRASDVSSKLAVMMQAGIEAKELDLRAYFGKQDELAAFIDSYRPDLIFAIGGNVFLLAAACHLSGFDKIVRNDLKQDKYVYGGNSAGAMLAADTLKYYGHDHLMPEAVPEIYGVDPIYSGLGLIDQYIIAHADIPDHAEATKLYKERIEKAGLKALLLNQRAAVVVDEDSQKILGQ